MTIGDIMDNEKGKSRRDFLRTGIGLAALGGITYSLNGCSLLKEDVSGIYEVKDFGVDDKYLLIDGVPKIYRLNEKPVRDGDGYNSLIFRHLEGGYNRMSSDKECRLPEILKDINGGELRRGESAWAPTDVITLEEYKEIMGRFVEC